MTYEIILHSSVPKEIGALPKPVRERVKAAIESLRAEPVPLGSVRLKGRVNAYRIRFGEFRMLYEVHATEIVIYIIAVGHRKEIYRRLRRR